MEWLETDAHRNGGEIILRLINFAKIKVAETLRKILKQRNSTETKRLLYELYKMPEIYKIKYYCWRITYCEKFIIRAILNELQYSVSVENI